MPRLISGLLLASALFVTAPAQAQDPVPQPVPEEPIARFVVDARGAFARLKANPLIAGAIGVETTDLPTRGLGLVVGAHVYPVRTRNFALGLGGEILLRARGSRTKPPAVEDGPDGPTVVTSMSAISPQVSLNFGRGAGWSYISGGIGKASFTSELEESPVEDPESRPGAINYGGGARWFTETHLAFSLDLRFYRIDGQEFTLGRPTYPPMTVMVFSAGISVR